MWETLKHSIYIEQGIIENFQELQESRNLKDYLVISKNQLRLLDYPTLKNPDSFSSVAEKSPLLWHKWSEPVLQYSILSNTQWVYYVRLVRISLALQVLGLLSVRAPSKQKYLNSMIKDPNVFPVLMVLWEKNSPGNKMLHNCCLIFQQSDLAKLSAELGNPWDNHTMRCNESWE